MQSLESPVQAKFSSFNLKNATIFNKTCFKAKRTKNLSTNLALSTPTTHLLQELNKCIIPSSVIPSTIAKLTTSMSLLFDRASKTQSSMGTCSRLTFLRRVHLRNRSTRHCFGIWAMLRSRYMRRERKSGRKERRPGWKIG